MSAIRHPDFSILAGRLYVAGLHKVTDKSFVNWVSSYGTDSFMLTGIMDSADGDPILSPEVVRLTHKFGFDLEDAIVHARDFAFSYASICSLANSYLLRSGGHVIERPQHFYMRVALAVHKGNLDMVLKTYDALSRHLFTFATPTLANAGTLKAHYASCFLHIPDTSGPTGMLKSAHDLDRFWLADGGAGLSLGAVPCRRSRPRVQPGVLALMQVYDAHARYTGLCRGIRPSAATVHLPIWHGDVRPFISCRSLQAQPDEQVQNLYVGVWVADLFMERSEANLLWSLFDPVDVPGLLWTYGESFSAQYIEYERTVDPVATIPARDLWSLISRAQEETGTPFVMYQDAINAKNNEVHLGIIKTSSLCAELVQFASPDQTAVCTLASVAAPRFVQPSGTYDFDGLHSVTKLAVQGVNALVDAADYPTTESRASAEKTRAVAVGVQGLADVFMQCKVAYASSLARDLNIAIFETIYHAAYQASCELAKTDGPYPLYDGSPASEGRFQHDMWPGDAETGRYDFGVLREQIRAHGLRNSMLTAQMPTASTARLLGNFDATEPYTSNVLVRRVFSGDYTEICPWLVRDLEERGLWNENLRLAVLGNHGSISSIVNIPDDLKEIYRTVWEIEPSKVIDLAADRAPFIDQTQAMSLNMIEPTADELLRIQLYAWRRGLKTGIYYLRTRPPAYLMPSVVGAEGKAIAPSSSSTGQTPVLEHARQSFRVSSLCIAS
ncbi:ribonucleotide reductase [Cerioporus squamosus]|nr:ribonucleotide reductase [Cerioporus squamosus]